MGFVALVLGLCFGSFLNVLIYRLPRGLGFVKGRSFCPKCKKKILWFDNVPLISYVLLRGRCRFCRSPISLCYPLVEVVCGILTLLVVNKFFFSISTLDPFLLFLSLLLVWGLLVIFFIDLKHQIIPDKIVFPLILLYSIFIVFNGNYSFLAAGIFSFVFFFLLYLITRGRGMGFGDVKLAFLMGLSLGFSGVIVAFYIAFLTGALTGVILILLGKAKFGQKIAFGPFLAFSTIIVLLWGEKIISFVQRFF